MAEYKRDSDGKFSDGSQRLDSGGKPHPEGKYHETKTYSRRGNEQKSLAQHPDTWGKAKINVNPKPWTNDASPSGLTGHAARDARLTRKY